jgi:hypothetical protein
LHKWCRISSSSGEDAYENATCSLANEEGLSIEGVCILPSSISLVNFVY